MSQTLLLVDDEMFNADALRQAVRDMTPPINVLVAQSVAQGLRLLQDEHHGPNIAAVLLDLALPDSPGLYLLMDLRAEAETKCIPVVVLSRKRTSGPATRRGLTPM